MTDSLPHLPWNSRIQRTSDNRFGTVVSTSFDSEVGLIIKWDRAIYADRHPYTRGELTEPKFRVFPAVRHCTGCGHPVDDFEVEDSYTTCCNEGVCGGCALVNGTYTCGTEAPADDE
ncbi:hypothetical protein [Streptomyces sp. BH055]|uniref:hypothetical protein n=1 Tax=unclassified Streptomyces TaxID=2593676 RepID=UPI003BB73C1E